MTITVASNTTPGTYPITVTGNGGGIQQNTTVTLTVTAAPSFTISASPASLSIQQGNQGNSTITTAISGGFNADIDAIGFGPAIGGDGELQSADHPCAGRWQLDDDHHGGQQHNSGDVSHHGDGQRRRDPAEHDSDC